MKAAWWPCPRLAPARRVTYVVPMGRGRRGGRRRRAASVWFAIDQYGGRTGRAIVQAVNGTLYEVAGGRQPAAARGRPGSARRRRDPHRQRFGRDAATARRVGGGTPRALRLLDHCDRRRPDRSGSIAAASSCRPPSGGTGHLYVATADCQVAVTGTVFSVVSGVKGSRVSVVEGEVHVSQDNQDNVLHPGDQIVTSPSIETALGAGGHRLEPQSRQADPAARQAARRSIQQIHMPALRYSSKLLDRLPADTASSPAFRTSEQYLAEAQGVFNQKLAQSPELRQLVGGARARASSRHREAAHGQRISGRRDGGDRLRRRGRRGWSARCFSRRRSRRASPSS